MRSSFTKNGGALGETGSVAFMFDRVGEIAYPPAAGSADKVLEAAIEAGADDVESDAGRPRHHHRLRRPERGRARRSRRALGEAETVKVVWKPQTPCALDEEKAASMMKLIEVLDDDDDVQNVYANFEVSDAVMEKLTA